MDASVIIFNDLDGAEKLPFVPIHGLVKPTGTFATVRNKLYETKPEHYSYVEIEQLPDLLYQAHLERGYCKYYAYGSTEEEAEQNLCSSVYDSYHSIMEN